MKRTKANVTFEFELKMIPTSTEKVFLVEDNLQKWSQ